MFMLRQLLTHTASKRSLTSLSFFGRPYSDSRKLFQVHVPKTNGQNRPPAYAVIKGEQRQLDELGKSLASQNYNVHRTEQGEVFVQFDIQKFLQDVNQAASDIQGFSSAPLCKS